LCKEQKRGRGGGEIGKDNLSCSAEDAANVCAKQKRDAHEYGSKGSFGKDKNLGTQGKNDPKSIGHILPRKMSMAELGTEYPRPRGRHFSRGGETVGRRGGEQAVARMLWGVMVRGSLGLETCK